MSNHPILIISLGFALGLAASACVATSDPNPSHCRNAQGDQTCAERYGEDRPFCTTDPCDGASDQFYDCVAERPADDCYYPCGHDKNVTVDDSCLIAGDGDMADGDMGDMGDGDGDSEAAPPCMSPADCADDAAPFCDLTTGACVGCGGTDDPDGACASLDPQLSLCSADACVACTPAQPETCVENTPVCDPQSNACVGCSAHAQCPASACNLAVGNCFDPAQTLHVDGDADCEAADGTPEMPYCEIDDALFFAAAEALIILHENDDQSPYAQSNYITRSIALFAADAQRPVLAGLPGQAPLSVTLSGRLFARGLELSGTKNNGRGLVIDGGRAWVEQSKIVDNKGGGILLEGGGTLTLVNSFVGGDVDDVAAIDVINGEVSVVFSTIAAGDDDARALMCVDGTASSVRNSIVVSISDDPEIDCPTSQIVDSFTEDTSGTSFDADWFVDFEAGDFHLVPGLYPETLEMAGIWRSGDPAVDIDGDPRPVADGTSEFVGADRLP